MFLDCVLSVLCSMDVVAMSQMRVVSSCLVVAGFMMRGGFVVVARSAFVMFRCLLVMICGFLRHMYLPSMRILVGLLSPPDCRQPAQG
jgi:hypothetical protein